MESTDLTPRSISGLRSFSQQTLNLFSEDGNEDETKDYNYRYSMLALTGILAATGIWFVIFFKCPYLRRDWGKGEKDNTEEDNDGFQVDNL